MIEVSIRIDSSDLDVIMARLQNTKPLMAGIANVLLDQTEKAFDYEGYPFRWWDIKDKTKLARKKRGHWPGKILQETSGLARSILPRSTSTEAEISTHKVYAAIHQFGGKTGRNKKTVMPARPFMPIRGQGFNAELTREAHDEIMGMIDDFLLL